jgi:hypothetical protein
MRVLASQFILLLDNEVLYVADLMYNKTRIVLGVAQPIPEPVVMANTTQATASSELRV